MPEFSILLWVVLIVAMCMSLMICIILSLILFNRLYPKTFAIRGALSWMNYNPPVADVVSTTPLQGDLGIVFTGLPYGHNHYNNKNGLAKVWPLNDETTATQEQQVVDSADMVPVANTVRGITTTVQSA